MASSSYQIKMSSMEKELSDLKKGLSTIQKGMSAMTKQVKGLPNLVKSLQEFFDMEAESYSDASAPRGESEVSDRDVSEGSHMCDSRTSDGPNEGAFDAETEQAETVAERVKETKRKRKTPSSLRSPMMIFKAAKKRNTTKASQPFTPKMKKGSNTGGSFGSKQTSKQTKNKSSTTTTKSQPRKKYHSGSVKNNKVVTDIDKEHDMDDMDALNPREVAAVQFIRNLCADAGTRKRPVVRTELTTIFAFDIKGHTIPRINDDTDNAKYICNAVIDAYAAHLALRITNNRRFSPVWQSFVLSEEDQVDRILEPANCVNYRDFATQFYNHDLVYFPLRLHHHGHRHWILVVMDNKKHEFQVLDSLWRPETYTNKIEMMRTGIERMTSFARQRSPNLPEDVGTWTIRPIDNLPQQDDGHSCGLFVMKYMELWNGRRLAQNFTQEDIHIFRMQLLSEIIFSPTNTLQGSKDDVERIMQGIN